MYHVCEKAKQEDEGGYSMKEEIRKSCESIEVSLALLRRFL